MATLGPTLHYAAFARFDNNGNLVHFDLAKAEQTAVSQSATQEARTIARCMVAAYNLAKLHYQP
jgi:hypothetical protein